MRALGRRLYTTNAMYLGWWSLD
uniref:Uncharacterized protein n=1 Tax=Arundo donax TaxID=35708 RepID=A0A0A9GUD5_ARUDO